MAPLPLVSSPLTFPQLIKLTFEGIPFILNPCYRKGFAAFQVQHVAFFPPLAHPFFSIWNGLVPPRFGPHLMVESFLVPRENHDHPWFSPQDF